MGRILGLFYIVFFFICACEKKEEKLFLRKNARQSGITFKNVLKDSPELNILTYLYYYNGGGVSAADFNNDGLIDLYFTANQGEDELYLNKGYFKFEEVTSRSKIENTGNWTTGVTHVDINADGLMDLYICKVGNYLDISGKNLLYVNQGNDPQGIPIFREAAAEYGLDFSGFSTQAAFFDYDLDGDLDMYLLNHSVHPNATYGKGEQRLEKDPLSGDRLYENTGGRFIDVSGSAGLYQGRIGYGLGLGISDLNEDGYPDIYVGNDFFENDYLYLNQQDGTFKEVISSGDGKIGHTSHYSMGNDLADINNDGKPDIISLDMLPEDLETYKTSGLEFPYPTYEYYLKNGYAPQYMQNTLHLNLGNEAFSEIAHLAGISASEWSWGALLADYDNDGHKDIFVSNGIKGATNDMDFINFIANESIQKRLGKGMSAEDMAFIDEMPVKKVPNYFFRNNGDLSFTDATEEWYVKEDSFSNGCAYADLDNDGDLDLVVNNVDEEAYLLENKGVENHNWLQLSFKGTGANVFGIGTKVIAYAGKNRILQENFVSRGYLSSVPPEIHLGLGNISRLDSLQIIWPGGALQTLREPPLDQSIEIDQEAASGNYYNSAPSSKILLTKTQLELDFEHSDPASLDFNREPLVPFAHTNEGPDISVTDFDADGLDDFLISGAKGQASALFIQTDSGEFLRAQPSLFEEDALSEDIAHVFFDADQDGDKDLLIVSGGNEFHNGIRLRPRLYLNEAGALRKDKTAFEGLEVNASSVAAVDFDGDGYIDVAITSDQQPTKFGQSSRQYLLRNVGDAEFIDVTDTTSRDFLNLGNVKDMIWADLDENGYKDLIAVGHWMPITILMNDGRQLLKDENSGLEQTSGWWNKVLAADLDADGDLDLIGGNWGMNSKFKASAKEPVTLYNYDFDDNGSIDPVVTHVYEGRETPFASKDELVKQMPFLNKEFLSYKAFAQAGMEELFGVDKLKKADKKYVYELRSAFMENKGDGHFEFHPLPLMAQAAAVQDIAIDDLNKDGHPDILLVGNLHEVSTQLGRMDALRGVVLQNNGKSGFTWVGNPGFDIPGPARSIRKIMFRGNESFLVGINNGKPVMINKTLN